VAFAVAGGRSTRMGRDKAELPWGGGDLLSHALDRLAPLTGDVRILCGPNVRYADRGRPVVPDVVTDVGGIAALLTALRQLADGQHAVLLAVDLPRVTTALLQHLLSVATEADVVVPASPQGVEPFAAVYGYRCREAVERAVAAGSFKMTGFFRAVRVREVPPEELRAFGDPATLFWNVNTPADYDGAGGSI
jgi:molybdenum cofactor guanylyltransferase